MKSILCYGDSNTWGYDPKTADRMDYDSRWPGVLRNTLGDGYYIIEEGLPGRTTVWDDPIEEHKNGKTYILPCIFSHMPDLVIIMLGTNDLKFRFSLTAADISKGAKLLADMVLKSNAGPGGMSSPRVLLIAPPPVSRLTAFAEMFVNSKEKSLKFGEYYSLAAKECGCSFLDAGKIIHSSDLDGIHLEKSQHEILGKEVAKKVHEILSF
ncbi:MAG: SGNH/GDSL hydrolase family protein [Chitinispirillia bacterium]|jgi:lysophospholipase L1-like esterase